MKTAGQILKQARLDKKISLVQAASTTKIRQKLLQALEADDYSLFPSSAPAAGLVRNYALFLGLLPASVLAAFRRDFAPSKKKEIFSQGMVRPINRKGLIWSPKLTLISLTIFFFLTLVVYLSYQYFSLARAPFLEIINPEEGKQTSEETIEIKGKTNPEALLKVNEQLVLVSEKGEFVYWLDLFPGENRVIVVAQSSSGKETREERNVFRLDK